MDIPSTILFGLLLLWLIGQAFAKYGDMKLEAGITAIVLVAILVVDCFYRRNILLGNPGGFWHAALKLFLDLLLIVFVGSGVTAILRSKNIVMALFNVIWSGGLTAGVLKLMKVL